MFFIELYIVFVPKKQINYCLQRLMPYMDGRYSDNLKSLSKLKKITYSFRL